MRTKLKQDEGIRKKFIATFSKIGKKKNFKGYSEDTILLTNVKDAATMETVTDHVWFTYTKTFESARLSEGMMIEFEARIREYTKGYKNTLMGINQRRKDYKLSHPGRIRIISQ